MISSRSFALRLAGIVLALIAVAWLTSGCGGDDGDGDELFPRVVSLGDSDVYANVLNSSLTVGPNRMIMQLEDDGEAAIAGARVHLRFFDLNGEEPHPAVETDAHWQPVELSYIDEGAGEPERVPAGESGAYIANVLLSRAGDWGVRITVTTDEQTYDEFPFRFTVRERSDEPMIGDPAPQSVQATLETVSSIEEIDSSYPPRPAMHDTTIADAIASGRPAVIAFATPAFCTSRICAPVMDTVMDPLFAGYSDRATFIHVEPYVLRDVREANVRNPVPAAREWMLQTEPWVFVVGADGLVRAKFEGIIGVDEVERELLAALAP